MGVRSGVPRRRFRRLVMSLFILCKKLSLNDLNPHLLGTMSAPATLRIYPKMQIIYFISRKSLARFKMV